MKKVVIITGQTATGKTNLALNLAKKIGGELINCDSRQIYKLLDIITGKDLEEGSKFKKVEVLDGFDVGFYSISGTKVWLYDIVYPNKYFSSFDFKNLALHLIKKLLKKNITPIIVGGTYFYIYHLLYKLHTENLKPDFKLRKKLQSKTVAELQKILEEVNPELFNKLNQSDKNNPVRLIRKIEISLQKKDLKIPQEIKPDKIVLTEKLEEQIEVEYIGLKFKDEIIARKKIENRVEERLKKGAVEEVKKLLQMGYDEKSPGLRTIGYRQILKYLKGEISFNQAIEEWIKREIKYTKQQFMFMKRDRNIKWRIVEN